MAGHRATRNAKARKKYRETHPKTKKTAKKPAERVVTKKMGRPPIPYDPNRHPEWVRGLASRGSSVKEICAAMEISSVTLYAWRDKYPDFAAALQVGRNETVALMTRALHKRAMGFSVELPPEKKITEMSDGTTRKEITVRTAYFPPDVSAAKIALVNLDPDFKTERTAMELTGPGGGPLAVEKTIIVLPDNGRGPAPKVLPADVKKIE